MTRIRRRLGDDSGIGMVLVIGIMALVTGLIATAAIVAINGLRQSTERTHYEQAVAVAEQGIDQTLAYLQSSYDNENADYPVPSLTNTMNPLCQRDPITMPVSFASADAERTWAKTQIASLVAASPGCVQHSAQGDYVVIKPPTPLNADGIYAGFGRVYAMGWAPSRTAANAKARLLKTEYIFMPYRPSNAILTQGNLDISASTTVTVASGYDPTLAQVHANGTITTVGNPTVFGTVSSTLGSSATSIRFYGNTGGSVTTTPTQSVPRVDALDLYKHARSVDPGAIGSWYDLCYHDGVAIARPYNTSGDPCGSSTSVNPSLLGWSYDAASHTWTASKNVVSGTYYANEADIASGVGVASIPNLTLIASARNHDSCGSKLYGNINWDRYDPAAPALTNLFMYADSDLMTGANFNAGSIGGAGIAPSSGMFVAGDQVQMETSSEGAVGSVMTADQCTTSPLVTANQVKNPSVYFDPEAEAPFSAVISTTLWLEYVG